MKVNKYVLAAVVCCTTTTVQAFAPGPQLVVGGDRRGRRQSLHKAIRFDSFYEDIGYKPLGAPPAPPVCVEEEEEPPAAVVTTPEPVVPEPPVDVVTAAAVATEPTETVSFPPVEQQQQDDDYRPSVQPFAFQGLGDDVLMRPMGFPARQEATTTTTTDPVVEPTLPPVVVEEEPKQEVVITSPPPPPPPVPEPPIVVHEAPVVEVEEEEKTPPPVPVPEPAKGVVDSTVTTTTTTKPPTRPAVDAVDASTLYTLRNQQVAAAANAGKSRWGIQETERIKSNTALQQALDILDGKRAAKVVDKMPQAEAAAVKEAPEPVMKEPLAPVEAPVSKPEPVVKAPPPPPPKAVPAAKVVQPMEAPQIENPVLYQQRTAQVMAAAAAGKSRWGKAETEHLATHVSLQKALLVLEQGIPEAVQTVQPNSVPVYDATELYNQRNANILAAAAATANGRWGKAEVEKTRLMVSLQKALRALDKGPGPTKNLFQARNEQVAKASGTGSSRWGPSEAEKATMAAGLKHALDILEFGAQAAASATLVPVASLPTKPKIETAKPQPPTKTESKVEPAVEPKPKPEPVKAPEPEPVAVVEEPPALVESTRLKQFEGFGMEPLRMPTPVKEEPATTTPSDDTTSLYELRTEQVAAAAEAGKSRWGTMETDKAKEVIGVQEDSEKVTTPAQDASTLYDLRTEQVVAAADAGKSRWGTMETDKAKQTVGVVDKDGSAEPAALYELRTEQVVAAAEAGKSRWGSMETDKAKEVIGVVDKKSTAEPAAPAQDTSLYELRSELVVAAAEAGKSRWGSMETDKAKEVIGVVDKKSTAEPAAPAQDTSLYELRSEQVVAAAEAGKSRWGSMETDKAKEVIGVVDKKSTAEPAAPAQDTSLYELRNELVVAAAEAGKSRWGSMETDKAKEVVSAVDKKSTANQAAPAQHTSLYELRTEQVVAAAEAGKSRWGSMETDKAKEVVSAVDQETSAATVTASQDTTLYELRSEQVVAAAEAGKSRWGSMETNKAKEVVNGTDDDLQDPPLPPPPGKSSPVSPVQQDRIKQRIEEMRQRASQQAVKPPQSSALPEFPNGAQASSIDRPEVLMVQNAASQMAAESFPQPHRPATAPPRALLQRAVMGEVIRRNNQKNNNNGRQSPTARAMSITDDDNRTDIYVTAAPEMELPFFAKLVVPEDELEN